MARKHRQKHIRIVGGPHDGGAAEYVDDGYHERVVCQISDLPRWAIYTYNASRNCYEYAKTVDQSELKRYNMK
jgi:hypothetical protein